MFVITVSTLQDERVNLLSQSFNAQKPLRFFYETDILLTGQERWVWEFDYQAATPEIKPITSIGLVEPLDIAFTRAGLRKVRVTLYDGATVLASDTVQFTVYEFPTGIVAPEYAGVGETVAYGLNSVYDAASYTWYVNGIKQNTGAGSLNVTFSATLTKAIVICVIENDGEQRTLRMTTASWVSNAVGTARYHTNVTDRLMFFNKEGDYLNFSLTQGTTTQNKFWDGDLIFHANSSDTYKTLGLYILEKVNPITHTNEHLQLQRVQLFNEKGMDFVGSDSAKVYIDRVEIATTGNAFYGKWLYASGIEKSFKPGDELILENFNTVNADGSFLNSSAELSEFASKSAGVLKMFTVVASKPNAVLVLTATDNVAAKSALSGYGYGEYTNALKRRVVVPQGYAYKPNFIRLHDVADSNAEWNEPAFPAAMYQNKRLSVVNTRLNDGLHTVAEPGDLPIGERIIKKTIFNSLDLSPTVDNGFKIEVESKSTRIVISKNTVDFLPASGNSALNNRTLVLWRGIDSQDATPSILRKNIGFAFDTNTEGANMQIQYKSLQTAAAKDLLTPQSTTSTGVKLSFANYADLQFGNSVVLTVDKTTYTLTIANPQIGGSGTWVKASTAATAYTSLSFAINNLGTISAYPLADGILLHPKKNATLGIDAAASTIALNTVNNYLATAQPEYGIVGDEWQELDTTEFSGYVHYVEGTDTFNLLYVNEVEDQFVKTWYALSGSKRVTWVETADPIEFDTEVLTTTYLLDTKLTFEVVADPTVSSSVLVQRFVNSYAPGLRDYGIDAYVTDDELVLARMHSIQSTAAKDDYVAIAGFTKGTSGAYVAASSVDESSTLSYVLIQEPLKSETLSGSRLKPSQLWNRKIIIKNIDSRSGLLLKINGLELPVAYDNIATPRPALEDKILDVEETLMDWGNQHYAETGKTYHETLEDMGILIWLEKSRESYVQEIPKYDTIVIESKYPNVPVQYDILNTLDSHKILHSDATFANILGAEFRVTMNGLAYTIANTGSVTSTLEAWVEEYADTLLEQNIVVETFEKTLRFSTLQERTKVKYQLWAGTANGEDTELYYITYWRTGNPGAILAGNEIVTTSGDFQQLGFATGMIAHVGNSFITANNKEYNIVFVDPQRIGLSYQGAFWGSTDNIGFALLRSGFDWGNYDERPEGTDEGAAVDVLQNVLIKTREFLRYPREGYDQVNPTLIQASWDTANDGSMFFFDFSGEQLDYLPSEAAKYTGVKPLLDNDDNGYLNKTYNKDVAKAAIASAQQTVFDKLTFKLDHIDEDDAVNPTPHPLQVFVGFKSADEGVKSNTLLLYRNENISVGVKTVKQNSEWRDVLSFDEETNTLRVINPLTTNFIDVGLKAGQMIRISGRDYLNTEKQLVFKNAGLDAEVLEVGVTTLVLNPLNKSIITELSYGQTTSILPPFRRKDSAQETLIEVLPALLANIRVKGQTEIEDERYKVLLNNMGHSVSEKDNYIFKEYDIKEKGIDWTFVNAKRKEMLMVFPEIYNFLSAYKSIINSINYFGYNDLELNEYYRNIDPTSKGYDKLIKIEIPDIFDNTVEGWTEKDYLKRSLPNEQFAKTKLFNLTYRITDFEGNNVLGYSLDEVLIKLLGLKNWLKQEVLMIGTTVKDLTGKGSTVNGTTLTQDSRMSQRMVIREYLEPVDFSIEAYLQPVVNNSKTYSVNVQFLQPNTPDKPNGFHLKITTYKKNRNGLRSVQIINEYRTTYQNYTFAVDEKAEQYIVVETHCDNGYGAAYNKKRSYNLINKTYIPKL